MDKNKIEALAQQAGQAVYDVSQGDVHTIFRLLVLQAAMVADLIAENQGDEEAHHFAHHMLQGMSALHQSTEEELSQFEEELSLPSLADILNSALVRGGRPQG